MFYVDALWIIVLGILAASGAIVAKRPDAKQMIDKLAPYQGWMGLVAGIWGIWSLIDTIFHIGLLGMGLIGIIVWILALAVSLLLISLGAISGTSLAKTYVKNPEAQARMDQLYTKLSPYRNTLGFIGIGLGIVLIILSAMR